MIFCCKNMLSVLTVKDATATHTNMSATLYRDGHKYELAAEIATNVI